MNIDKDILSLDELSISIETETTEKDDRIKDGMYKRIIRPIDIPEEKEPEKAEKPEKPGKRPEPPQKPVEDDNGDATSYLTDDDERKLALKDVTSGKVVRVITNPYTIGKKQDCDLIIEDDHVSRHHAELRLYGDKMYIRDLGSLNGTYVDGYKLPPQADMEIRPGQELTFANRKFIVMSL